MRKLAILFGLLMALRAEATQLQRTDVEPDATAARAEMLRIVDDTARVGRAFHLDASILGRLDQARGLLETAPAADLAAYARIAPQVRKLHELLEQAEAILHSRPARSAVESTGFPSAEDPNYNWNFFVPSQSASLDDAGGASDTTSASDSESGNCSFANRKTTQELFALLNGTAIAEVVQQVASRICEQVIVVLGGGNASIVCVITDIVYDVVKAIQDNIFLCEDVLDGAEASASYLRLGHLHTDLENAETNLTGAIASSTTTIENRVSSAETNLTNTVNANTSTIVSAVDATRNSILTVVQAGQDFTLRIEIEKALRYDVRLAVFFLPQAHGGQLELVRQIVSDTIDAVTASGLGVNAARARLASGDEEFARGKWKNAFHYYSQSYYEAIKILGDLQ